MRDDTYSGEGLTLFGRANFDAGSHMAIARVGETIPNAFAGDAHALLVAVYKDPRQDLHTRLDAAKAALPYEKPRLQAVTLANEGGYSHRSFEGRLADRCRSASGCGFEPPLSGIRRK